MSSSVMSRRRSRAAMRIASSSEVVVREVAKRKWSTSSSPRNIPKWVWVLPTSMVRSMGSGDYRQARDTLNPHALERALELVAVRGIELQERLEDEPPLGHALVGDLQVGRIHDGVVEQEQVDVKRPRRMARRVWVAAELDLDPLCRREQRIGVEI